MSSKNNKLSIQDYNTSFTSTWCPGCGNFAILTALKQAMVELNIPPHMPTMAFGIGCSGNMCNLIKTYGLHTLHGRTLPAAVGLKAGNNKLTVIAIGGDGDIYGEGGNHLIHIARMNYN